jgi:hypothetical protein
MTETASAVAAAGVAVEQAPAHTDELARHFARLADAADDSDGYHAGAVASTLREAATTAQMHADRVAVVDAAEVNAVRAQRDNIAGAAKALLTAAARAVDGDTRLSARELADACDTMRTALTGTSDIAPGDLVQQRDLFAGQVQRLAEWLLANMPHEIRGDVDDADTSAVGIAIRLMTPAAQQYAAMVAAGADWNSGYGWTPPAGATLPPGLLDDATEGARMLDAMASSAPARNLLAHALYRLVERGWINVGRHVTSQHIDPATLPTFAECLAAARAECAAQWPEPESATLTVDEVAARLSTPDAQRALADARQADRELAEPDVEVNPSTLAAMKRIAEMWPAVEYDAEDRPEEVAGVVAAARAAGLVPVPSETISPRTFRGCALPAAPSTAERWALDPAAAGAGLRIDADAACDAAVQSALVAVDEALRPLLASLWRGGLTVGTVAVAPAEGGQ